MSKTGKTTRSGRGGGPVRLPEELGIEQVRALHAQLQARVKDTNTVMLDGSEVGRVHAAGMQLLCAFFRDRRLAGRETAWRQASETLRNGAALAGMTQLIQL